MVEQDGRDYDNLSDFLDQEGQRDRKNSLLGIENDNELENIEQENAYVPDEPLENDYFDQQREKGLSKHSDNYNFNQNSRQNSGNDYQIGSRQNSGNDFYIGSKNPDAVGSF